MKPDEIEHESFRIILEELGPDAPAWPRLPIVQRVIHATADFEFARTLAFSPSALDDALTALRAGAPVVTDVTMVASGISRGHAGLLGCPVRCAVHDPETAALATAEGITRSAAALRRLSTELPGAVVAIGNAPTAIREVLRLAGEGVRPAVVIGVPVGFVDAAESKDDLATSDLPFITSRGRKGGSTVAAAIVNALLRLAMEPARA